MLGARRVLGDLRQLATYNAPSLMQVAGNNSSNTGITTLTVNMLYPVSQNQLIIAFLGFGNATVAISGLTSPAGFTSLGTSGFGTVNAQCAVQSKTAGIGEPGSYTWSWTGSTFAQITIAVFDVGAVIDGSPSFNNAGAGGGTVWPCAGGTASQANEYWLSAVYTSNSPLVVWWGVTTRTTGTVTQPPLVMFNLMGLQNPQNGALNPNVFLGGLAGLQLQSAGALPTGPNPYAWTQNAGNEGNPCTTTVLVKHT